MIPKISSAHAANKGEKRMKFNNAYEGVKKIFTAEILSLIVSICSTITQALPVIALAAAASKSDTGTFASLGGFAVFAIGSIVLAIIAFILKLIGVSKASKDEPAFKIAFYMIFVGIAASVVSGIFSSNPTVHSIVALVIDIIDLAVTVYIIQGIMNLAKKLNDESMVDKGKNIFIIIIVIYMLIIIAQIVNLIIGSAAALVISAVVIIVSGILSIIQYFLYLSYLNKAKKMLA